MAGRSALDISRLGVTSRAVAEAVLALNNGIGASAEMEEGVEDGGQSLVIDLESPTGDESRRVGIWIDESGIPSIRFGAWHTHSDLLVDRGSPSSLADAVVEVLASILRDDLVLIVDVGGEYSGHTSVLDLRAENALLEELTSRYSPGRVAIKSWSGKVDREVGLDELGA